MFTKEVIEDQSDRDEKWYLQFACKELKRIRTNVVFFTWVVMLYILFQVILSCGTMLNSI